MNYDEYGNVRRDGDEPMPELVDDEPFDAAIKDTPLPGCQPSSDDIPHSD